MQMASLQKLDPELSETSVNKKGGLSDSGYEQQDLLVANIHVLSLAFDTPRNFQTSFSANTAYS